MPIIYRSTISILTSTIQIYLFHVVEIGELRFGKTWEGVPKVKYNLSELKLILIRSEPLFIFDLGASVGDVKWAPYSSTVLAAVTTEGKVYVFDINVNKYKAICVQQVVNRKSVKLTRIAFNQKLPFLIVGDDK